MAKRKVILAGLLVAVALAFLFSPFASQAPDGLEKVAETMRFMHRAEGKEVFRSPIPDYTLPGIKNEKVATSLAGLIGTILTFGVMYLIGYFLIKRRSTVTVSQNKNPQS